MKLKHTRPNFLAIVMFNFQEQFLRDKMVGALIIVFSLPSAFIIILKIVITDAL